MAVTTANEGFLSTVIKLVRQDISGACASVSLSAQDDLDKMFLRECYVPTVPCLQYL